MFTEFTEIIMDRMSTYSSKPKERPISINPEKIQAFYPEGGSTNTILRMRKGDIKVTESYEEIKSAIQKLKN